MPYKFSRPPLSFSALQKKIQFKTAWIIKKPHKTYKYIMGDGDKSDKSVKKKRFVIGGPT